MEIYNNINQNDIDFEMVFVGPNHPDFALPENFIFIYSEVKPTQCVEIAIRESTGSLVVIIADDIIFLGNRPLEKLVAQYNKLNNYKSILSCRLKQDNIPFDIKYHRFNFHDLNSPLLPCVGVMSKKLLKEIGSIDNRFIASMHDVDLYMRAIKLGSKIEFSEIFVNENKKEKSEGSNTGAEFFVDTIFSKKLWVKNEKGVYDRIFPVIGFLDKDIRFYSQGPRGRWRGSMPKLLEYLIDTILKKILTFCIRILSFNKYPRYFRVIMKRL
tara:strand:+ start:769 stop:1578 length:810 start_codon:yes stop_codon:yes gene_type:complete